MNLMLILSISTTTISAQNFDYLQAARDTLLKGDCEKAQRYYNVYKEIEKKTDYELERQINDCLASMRTERKSNWREEEVRSEIEIGTVSREYTLKRRKEQNEPTEKEWYDMVFSSVIRNYPNRLIGVSQGNGVTVSNLIENYQYGVLQDQYMEYKYKHDIKILEPNIRYYLNEAIRNAKDGSKIVLNEVLSFGSTDENLENQLMDILIDEGFRVVSNELEADYYIKLKMNNNSLQIRMINASTGDYEGVSTVKYDSFIDEIKIGKGGIVCDVEKKGCVITIKH